MKTHFGRNDDLTAAISRAASVGTTTATLFKRGRDTVLALGPQASAANDQTLSTSGSEARPTLSPEQRVLMHFVDGRQSIARLARLAGLAEDVAARALFALCDRGLLVHVEPNEVTIHARGGAPFYKLGPYEIAARVGQGGMGSVYVCRRIGAAGFKRLFALKVVRQGVGQDDAASRAFVREMSVGRILTHPNVQSVVDVGMYSDQPYLVLDYVEGTDLGELLAGGVPLPPGVLVTIILDVLRGLQAAHDVLDEQGQRVGLAHGDVSPPNILIGIDGVARLADFGNARFTARGETAQNAAGAVGKPAFMAPELLRGEPSGQRADLFAVGVVMWTALTGTDLFTAGSYEEILNNVLSKEIVPPSTHGAPACLDDVVMRALSRQPQWRYATPDELAGDLLRVAVANGLWGQSAQVAEHVRSQLGDKLTDRRRQIEDGFCGVRTDPSLAAGSSSFTSSFTPLPEVAAIPAVGRRAIAPTVVLPQSRPAPAAPSGGFRLRPSMVAAVAISLGIVAFTVTAALSNRFPNIRPRAALAADPAARRGP